jgi:hypothetical protein
MTTSHTLLHCSNDKVRAAREEASGRKDRGVSGPCCPTYEKKAPLTPKLSVGGGTMGDMVEEDARTRKLDRWWIRWETEKWVVRRAPD